MEKLKPVDACDGAPKPLFVDAEEVRMLLVDGVEGGKPNDDDVVVLKGVLAALVKLLGNDIEGCVLLVVLALPPNSVV